MDIENKRQNEVTGSSQSQDPAKAGETFIFLDAAGNRWSKLKLISSIIAVVLFFGLTVFTKTLFVPSEFIIPEVVQQIKGRLKALQDNGKVTVKPPLWLRFVKTDAEKAKNSAAERRKSASIAAGSTVLHKKQAAASAAKEVHLGFYEGWDPDSLDSLQANAGQLTHLSPDWINLSDGRGRLKVSKNQDVVTLVREKGIVLLPRLTNMDEMGDGWVPDVVEGLINGPGQARVQFIQNLTSQLKTMGAGGVLVDFENIDPFYKDAMTAFLVEVASALHDQDMELWLCLPVGVQLKIFDLDALADDVDRFVAMLHDENGESDPAGPIASWAWFHGWLDTLLDNYGEPGQWVIALGSYGYDWSDVDKEASTLSFEDVMSRAFRSALQSCEFDSRFQNPYFSYENEGSTHFVWFLDAVTFLNQINACRAYHVGGIAISRLGTEDPGIWRILDARIPPSGRIDPELLATINPGETIANFDKGNFISMEDERADGKRQIFFKNADGAGNMAMERYDRFPSYITIVHEDSVVKNGVAITFDDGPDPEWTPQLLDILKEKGVKAAFFMVGLNMEQHPDIVKRIYQEGHAIGIHTYTHPNIALVSDERARLEFNASQRLIEAITGHSTILFRPPYNADTSPHDRDELVPVKLAKDMGYITVTEDVDPEDWATPGVDTIVEKVREGRIQGGNVVLLHDAGGNRSQTVAALPEIIDYLRARGDNVLALPEMFGFSSAQLMPAVQENQQSITRAVSRGGFRVIHEVTDFFWAFMIVATSLVVLRTLVISFLAVRNRDHDKNLFSSPQRCPPVSILIAAYNEEKVIKETLRALLSTNYAGEIELVVVDDGSQDNTAAIVEAMANNDGRITLVRQSNCGKATALKNGLDRVHHDIVVTLDADTQFEPGTVSELVMPLLADSSVAAVSGRARVGNLKTMVSKFQSLEYTCGFNLDRRAYHQLNCITVVPGAVSSLRKSAVFAAGGISTDTLAEDTDLTLSLHKSGFKVAYASRAVAWTEAPETFRAFSRQRFRWAFGTLQCLWKHREMLFDSRFGALGWFSLPSAWFFNIFLVAIGPVIDVVLLCSLFLRPSDTMLYFYFCIFLLADLLLAAVACWIEKEPLGQIRLVIPMRFVYRPLLSYAVVCSITRALKGVIVGWGKLDRTASVTSGSFFKAH